MERIGDGVRQELARFGPTTVGMAEIVTAWPGTVGEQIARNAWPARLSRDGTLHVATASAAWAFELDQLAGDLLERLGTALGDAAPARLRFAVGRLPEPTSEKDAALQGKTVPAPSLQDRAEAERIAAAVGDEELRALVARAAAASLAKAALRPRGLVDFE